MHHPKYAPSDDSAPGGGILALTLVAAPAAGAQTATDGNRTAVGVELDAWTITGITIDGNETERIRRNLAANLSVPADNVRLHPARGTAEVFGSDLSTAAIADGFAAAGFSPSAVRRGVTDRTRATVVEVLQARLDVRGIDATAKTVTVNGIEHVVVAGANRTQVVPILRNRGRVEIVAHYPVTVDGRTVYRETELLENEDFVRIGSARASRPFTDRPTVKVFLGVEAAREAAGIVKRAGFLEEGVTACPDDAAQNPDTARGYCVYTYFNGEFVSARSLGGDIAWAINFQEYEDDPSVYLITETVREAKRLAATLRTGAFPVPLRATRLSEPVREAALANVSEPADEPVDRTTATPVGDTTPEEPTPVSPGDVATDGTPETPATGDTATAGSAGDTAAATSGGSTANSTGTLAITDAAGPGFAAATALVALTLAAAALLAARVR
ncbi:MAG: hypothetical protein ABEJ94_11065 [Halorientalis sp.]